MPGLAGDRHSAAMICDDAVNPGEAESSMPLLGAEEGLEDAREVFRFYPFAVIAKFDADIQSGCQFRGAVMRQFGDIEVPRRDGDVAAFSDGFDGVLDDPDDGLLNFCLVELHRVKMLLQLHLPLDSSGLEKSPPRAGQQNSDFPKHALGSPSRAG